MTDLKERAHVGAHELSTLLWRERELLEMLLFKLEEEQLLLTAGKSRWLPFATREVEQVLERLRAAGLERSVEVAALADEWGTSDDATLRDIISGAPDDAWREVFTAHLAALTDLTAQIAGVRDSNVQYLRAAARSTQETLARLNPEAGTYDTRGTTASGPSTAHLFEKDL
ncbi:FlgN protein [Diaminobutyricimonas aerilata]|uniref:FlgN protein n=1 Tax=Diaminobutyricimonas aerilata TaxID=1162967 RepID=A0A2M9CN15_9MICO|nr:flagellar protein FlgN [Diaminobutyricimonas aerilata]PJJ73299.1 FlgN protein [Diaminobutyricimonas aerilata]